MFCGCEKLKRVIFQDGSKLVTMEEKCFSSTAIEEFMAPPALRNIGKETFSSCRNLKYVELNEGLKRLVSKNRYQNYPGYRNA